MPSLLTRWPLHFHPPLLPTSSVLIFLISLCALHPASTTSDISRHGRDSHRLLHVRRHRIPRQALPVLALPLPLPALLLHELLRRRSAGVGRSRHMRLVPERRLHRQGEKVRVCGREAAAGLRQP